MVLLHRFTMGALAMLDMTRIGFCEALFDMQVTPSF